MKITPQDIHTQEFKRRLRGYDMDEVDAFLQQVADELESRVRENQQYKDDVKRLEERLAEYVRKDEDIKDTLKLAKKMVDDVKDTSRREAEAASAQARAEAHKVVVKAHEQLVRYQTQIDELKRYRDAAIIRFKSFLDTQFKLLKDFALSESREQPAPGPARAAGGEVGKGAPAPANKTSGDGNLEIEVTRENAGEEPVG
jgi:cell division initiation protein